MFSKKLTSIVAILSLGFFTFQSCTNDTNDSDDEISPKSLVTETMRQSVMNKITGNWIEPKRAEPWIVEIKNDGSWNNSTLNDLDKITILSEKEAMSVLSKTDIKTFGLTTFDDGTNLDKKGFFKMKNERYRQYRIIDENNISLKYQNGSMLYLTRNNSSNQNNSGSVTEDFNLIGSWGYTNGNTTKLITFNNDGTFTTKLKDYSSNDGSGTYELNGTSLKLNYTKQLIKTSDTFTIVGTADTLKLTLKGESTSTANGVTDTTDDSSYGLLAIFTVSGCDVELGKE